MWVVAPLPGCRVRERRHGARYFFSLARPQLFFSRENTRGSLPARGLPGSRGFERVREGSREKEGGAICPCRVAGFSSFREGRAALPAWPASRGFERVRKGSSEKEKGARYSQSFRGKPIRKQLYLLRMKPCTLSTDEGNRRFEKLDGRPSRPSRAAESNGVYAGSSQNIRGTPAGPWLKCMEGFMPRTSGGPQYVLTFARVVWYFTGPAPGRARLGRKQANRVREASRGVEKLREASRGFEREREGCAGPARGLALAHEAVHALRRLRALPLSLHLLPHLCAPPHRGPAQTRTRPGNMTISLTY